MSGQGLAGFFASVAMICAIASGSELSESAFGYFITACAVIILTIICYLGLPRLEFYRYYQQLKLEGPGEQETKLDLISKGEEPRAGKEESGVSVSNSQPTNESHSIKAILKNVCREGYPTFYPLSSFSPFAPSLCHPSPPFLT
ncbi:PREDICTED: equilibrative nucleoside transporter 1-like [Rhinopithecus bieti]|uniref:equilibrative nucleoside transporter 1-like n=1 Tax=Rhinopithecus bieti TaxID=61621 RepID=UPI00083C1B44|nr:PREDICTED: equilibrative nucleoside transporter 1-like [Rhinopithecus bieti]